jgi:hypothetical protein
MVISGSYRRIAPPPPPPVSQLAGIGIFQKNFKSISLLVFRFFLSCWSELWIRIHWILSGSSISSESGSNPDPGFWLLMTKNWRRKNTAENYYLSFFDKKMQFTYVQATGEALQREQENIQLCKNEISGSLLPSGYGSGSGSIHSTDVDHVPGVLSWHILFCIV